MRRGSRKLPRHMPPMNVPSSTPIDTDEEPTNSSSIWNQTISYISAAHPLPTNSSSRIGSHCSVDELAATGSSLWAMVSVYSWCKGRGVRGNCPLPLTPCPFQLLVMRGLIMRLQHIVAEV